MAQGSDAKLGSNCLVSRLYNINFLLNYALPVPYKVLQTAITY